jgi:hypothetical protein
MYSIATHTARGAAPRAARAHLTQSAAASNCRAPRRGQAAAASEARGSRGHARVAAARRTQRTRRSLARKAARSDAWRCQRHAARPRSRSPSVPAPECTSVAGIHAPCVGASAAETARSGQSASQSTTRMRRPVGLVHPSELQRSARAGSGLAWKLTCRGGTRRARAGKNGSTAGVARQHAAEGRGGAGRTRAACSCVRRSTSPPRRRSGAGLQHSARQQSRRPLACVASCSAHLLLRGGVALSTGVGGRALPAPAEGGCSRAAAGPWPEHAAVLACCCSPPASPPG